MTASVRWLQWALFLVLAVALLDIVACSVGVGLAGARTGREAGTWVVALLGGYLLFGLGATALFWWRGAAIDAGTRTVATIAFLIAQGLLFALMSMATMVATNR